MFLLVFSAPALRALLCILALAVLTVAAMVLYYRRRAADGKSIPWRKINLYLGLLGFVALCVLSEPLFRALVYFAFGVSERVIGENAPSNQVAADHVIGGWVQVGTLLSKLFAAISFYLLSYTLPWLMQRATHPVLTEWAKSDQYQANWDKLGAKEHFEIYGRLQTNQSIRLAASLLSAALLV